MNARALVRSGLRAGIRTGRFAPILVVSVIVLVACVNQRFSVTRLHQENRDLEMRLERLRDDVERARGRISSLTKRERIEEIALSTLALELPEPERQAYLPEWRETPPVQPAGGSLAAGILGSAGRRFDRFWERVGRLGKETRGGERDR
jgi:cell division protein FtsL